jgi:hypothetical protein
MPEIPIELAFRALYWGNGMNGKKYNREKQTYSYIGYIVNTPNS